MTRSEFDKIDDLPRKLDVLHRMMRSGGFTPDEVSEIMKDQIRPAMVSYIARGMEGKYDTFTDADKQNIFLLIQILQYLYNYSGLETGLTDLEYDSLYEIYINLGNEEFITVDLPFDVLDTAKHKYPSLRGTLTKVYYLNDNVTRTNPSRKYLSEWISSREKELYEKTGKRYDLKKESVYVFPKWDGVSCIFEFAPNGRLNTALTRGNVYTNVAQNITNAFPKMRGDITKHGYGLKTEIMMREEDLDYYNKKYGESYKNTRSIVSGILNADTCDERNELLVIQRLRTSTLNKNGEESLQELDHAAFKSPYIECKLGDVDLIEEFAQSHRYVDGLRCDGAVIYIKDKKLRELLGREDNKNKYEVAYKFTEETALTKLKEVIFQVGINGKISPVAVVKPVTLKGNRINRISLGSIQRFYELDLREGDQVKVLYDIIPYMVKDLDCKKFGDKKIKSPTHCPYCHEELERNQEGFYVRCVNPNCDCRKKGAILNYVRKMDIMNISTATVDDFFDAGILRNIVDLYYLKKQVDKIKAIDGYGQGKVDIILDSIESHKVVPDYQLLGAIGIDGIAIESAKAILSKYPMDDLIEICMRDDIDAICEIPGIKEKKAKKIISGVKQHRAELIFLKTILTITHPQQSGGKKFSVVFTKIRDPLIEQEIRRRGGEVKDSLTKDTTYLVVPDKNASSGKIEKARKYGTKIVPIDDIIAVIDEKE